MKIKYKKIQREIYMRYDFDKVFNKENTDSVKWNFTKKILGCDDVIPMCIADMDFETVPEVK